MGTFSLRDRLQEFFTLSRAEREARALPDSQLRSIERSLTLVRQRREAAETLWPRGSASEAMKLARTSLLEITSTLDEAATSIPSPPPWLARAQAIAEAAKPRALGLEVPELEADVLPAHEATFHEIQDALSSLADVAGPVAEGAEGFARRRLRRRVGAVVLVLGGGLALIRLAHRPPFAHAQASGELRVENSAEKAIDEDTTTCWMLPDHQTGFIDLSLRKPRSIRSVRVAQGNPPWSDRGTKDARIETFLGKTLVKGVDVTFAEPPKGEVTWTSVALDSPPCDRVRFTIKSSYQQGGGLTEIELN